METGFSWIVFSYKVPSEPSTLRVRIWRNLKELGVVYIQQSVCVAPDTPEVRKKLMQIKKLIESSNGEAHLLEVSKFSVDTEERLIDTFNGKRTLEYQEFLEGCAIFQKEIETETAKGNFTFHEVEENEADLLKLKRWFRKIMKRDFFASPMLAQAKNRLDQCENLLVKFTHRVYQSEGYSEGQIVKESATGEELDDM
ncbi:Chromate resistance protein ChrB [Effusibacillus pohliae]|uniref:Chromate resistance protein ChrB n=1 Tax=Effusibacillus pohliae TaxID=232270 RepID=UPI0003788778|nr:Chromate resistance protein ChrB [Effusibacillus pohliae]